MAVLDTTVLIDLLRNPKSPNHLRASQKLATLKSGGQVLATTRINAAELFVGVELSSNPGRESARVDALLTPLVMLELDDAAARRFGAITAYLQRHGTPSGDADVLIAAIAMANGHSVVTRNPKHFVNVPGIMVDPY